jgi:hypothetical protein
MSRNVSERLFEVWVGCFLQRVLWPLIREGDNIQGDDIQYASTSNRPAVNANLTSSAMWRGLFRQESELRHMCKSSDVIGDARLPSRFIARAKALTEEDESTVILRVYELHIRAATRPCTVQRISRPFEQDAVAL